MTKPTTKAEVKSAIRDIRMALRHAEAAMASNDWDQVVECLGYWASPSAATIAEQINEARNLGRD